MSDTSGVSVVGISHFEWGKDIPDFSQALCRFDPDLFFSRRAGDVRQAKKVCSKCPCKAECLEWAMKAQPSWGIWAGLTAYEVNVASGRRKRIRRVKDPR